VSERDWEEGVNAMVVNVVHCKVSRRRVVSPATATSGTYQVVHLSWTMLHYC